MPELRIKDVRLPELHLPEMSREDIVRAIGDARRDIDLTRLDPRRIERPDRTGIDLSRIDLSKVDVSKAIVAATQAASLVRASRRVRLPFLVGGVVAVGLLGFAIAMSPPVRPRLADLARRARQRLEERRIDALTDPGTDIAVDGADGAPPIAIPIEPATFIEPSSVDATESNQLPVEVPEATRA